MLKSVGYNCKTPLGETTVFWKVDQHQQSQSEMFPSQLENRASLLQPGPRAASPQPTQKSSVTKPIKRSIKCPNMFPNKVLTWHVIKKKRQKKAPGCITASEHQGNLCLLPGRKQELNSPKSPHHLQQEELFLSLPTAPPDRDSDLRGPPSLAVCCWYLPGDRVPPP